MKTLTNKELDLVQGGNANETLRDIIRQVEERNARALRRFWSSNGSFFVAN